MTEEEKLQKAYFVLGLEPGSPLDSINRRHKRLIMVWHPDRFPTEDGKKDAEEELKKINNAKDDLKKHFDQSHKASGACACKPSQGASTQSSNQGSGRSGQGPGPGPGKRKTTQENNREEAEAQRRSREREAQAAAEAAEKERQRQAAASAQAAQQSAQAAAEQTKLLADCDVANYLAILGELFGNFSGRAQEQAFASYLNDFWRNHGKAIQFLKPFDFGKDPNQHPEISVRNAHDGFRNSVIGSERQFQIEPFFCNEKTHLIGG